MYVISCRFKDISFKEALRPICRIYSCHFLKFLFLRRSVLHSRSLCCQATQALRDDTKKRLCR